MGLGGLPGALSGAEDGADRPTTDDWQWVTPAPVPTDSPTPEPPLTPNPTAEAQIKGLHARTMLTSTATPSPTPDIGTVYEDDSQRDPKHRDGENTLLPTPTPTAT